MARARRHRQAQRQARQAKGKRENGYVILCQSYTEQYQRTEDARQTCVRQTDRKMVSERKREEHKTLLVFSSPKTCYYYWLLIFYFNMIHLLWTNKK